MEEMETKIQNEQYRLAHAKDMRMLLFLGITVLIAILGLVGTMVGLTVWMISTDAKDVGVVLGIFATVGGIITTSLAYLAPSPIQNMTSSRRASDPPSPAGTPADPISTNEVSSQTISLANTTQEEQDFGKGNSANAVSDVDLTPDDDDLKADAMNEFSEMDFAPSNPMKRGIQDSFDDSYTKEECDDCKSK